MADNTEKKILLAVQILDNFVEAKKNLDAAKKAMDDFIKSGNTNIETQRTLAINLAKSNNEYRNAKKVIESTVKSQDILAAGVNTANKTLGEMQRELAALRNTPLDPDKPEQAKAIKQAMADLTVEISKYKNEIKGMDTAQTFKNLAGSLQGLSGAVQSLVQIGSIFGVENEALQKLSEKTKEFISITQGLGAVTEMLEKKRLSLLAANIKNIAVSVQNSITTNLETLSKSLNAKATAAQTAAENGGIIAKTKAIVITKLAAAAQWLWNAAMAANPVMLLVIAIAAAIAAIALLISWLSKSSKAEKDAEAASKAYETQAQKTADTIDSINRRQTDATNKRSNELRQEILDMKANGATAAEIAKAKAKGEEDLRNIEIAASKDRWKENYTLLILKNNEIAAQQKLLNEHDKGSKKYKEQEEKIRELIRAKNELLGTMQGELQTQKDLSLKNAEAIQKQKEDDKKAAKDRAKKYQDNALKMLDLQKKVADEQNKLTETSLSKDFLSQQKWNAQKFADNQKYEKEKLDMQLKFKQISAVEYAKQNEILDLQQQTFNQNQLNELSDHYKKTQEALCGLIQSTAQEQIADLKKQYDEAMKILNQEPPKQKKGQSDDDYTKELNAFEDYQFQIGTYAARLAEERTKKENEIRENALKKDIDLALAAADKEYAEDFAKYQDNEAKKSETAIEQQKKRSEEILKVIQSAYEKEKEELIKRGASQKELDDLEIKYNKDKNIQIANDNAELKKLEFEQSQINLNRELLSAHNNARLIYDAKKKSLLEEQKLYADDADRKAKIASQLADIEKEYAQARIDSFEEFSSKSMELMSAINEFSNALAAGELQQYEDDNEQKKQTLDNRLKNGLISQENYDKQIAALDADLDKKKAEIARKQAQREKLLKLFEIGINTAAAIMKLWVSPGYPMAIPLTIMTTALGVIQAATVLATPLPKASRGMLLKGKSHAQGGIPIEAEGGEVIMNKRSSAMFAPLLSAMNVAGGGVPFARPLSDGGYSIRSSRNQNQPITAKEMAKIINDMKIFTAIEDINDEQQVYSKYNNFKAA
ncbi:MAG: hypothetical protein FWD66_01080 [Paludibacter sp.]|nr:hypothetical protein [Paludibacter sp.]